MKPLPTMTSANCLANNVTVVTSALHELAESLGAAVDAKDAHTSQHSLEVSEFSYILAESMGIGQVQAEVIHVAAHLHDVGKIGVPDAILLKPGPLSDSEMGLMRAHTTIGAEIIRPVSALCQCGVLEMVLHHHERFDGQGYPHGLAGPAIPMGARIIAVADSFSAMLQDRPYRRKMSLAQACEEIRRGSGSQFDPDVVQAFEDCLPMLKEKKDQHASLHSRTRQGKQAHLMAEPQGKAAAG